VDNSFERSAKERVRIKEPIELRISKVAQLACYQSRLSLHQNACHAVIFFDSIRVKIRDEGFMRNKAVYITLGIQPDSTKEVLGIWIEQTEGAKFWMRVMTDLKNRGITDILITVVNKLKGFPDAITAVFLKASGPDLRSSLTFAGQIRRVGDLWGGIREAGSGLIFLVEFGAQRRHLASLEVGDLDGPPALGGPCHGGEHELENQLFAKCVGNDLEPPATRSAGHGPGRGLIGSTGAGLELWPDVFRHFG